jgi:hypothetical protein
VLWAIFTLVGFVFSAKATTERLTLRYLARKKERAHERAVAMMAANLIQPAEVAAKPENPHESGASQWRRRTAA